MLLYSLLFTFLLFTLTSLVVLYRWFSCLLCTPLFSFLMLSANEASERLHQAFVHLRVTPRERHPSLLPHEHLITIGTSRTVISLATWNQPPHAMIFDRLTTIRAETFASHAFFLVSSTCNYPQAKLDDFTSGEQFMTFWQLFSSLHHQRFHKEIT